MTAFPYPPVITGQPERSGPDGLKNSIECHLSNLESLFMTLPVYCQEIFSIFIDIIDK
jgi:hypothetical protein